MNQMLLHDQDTIQESNFQASEQLRKHSSHPLSNIIGNPKEDVQTRSKLHQMVVHCAFVSQIEPKHFNEANNDPN